MDSEHSQHWEASSVSLPDTYFTAYDKLIFTRNIAERMVTNAKLTPGQRVLDVACGTGWAAMAAARVIGINGKVIGVDVEKNWLVIAMEKAASARLLNIEYTHGNAEALDFDDNIFDVVLCASSIFLFNNILKALREWYRVLKSGGIVAFTSFGDRYLQPVIKPLGECLSRYDGQPPADPSFIIERTDSPEKCRELLRTTGFSEIDITTEDMGYSYSNAPDYWQEITLTFVGIRMAHLSPADFEKLKAEHFAEINLLYGDMPIPVEVPIHFSIAKKPLL
jgi:arsenite methyltransferase